MFKVIYRGREKHPPSAPYVLLKLCIDIAVMHSGDEEACVACFVIVRSPSNNSGPPFNYALNGLFIFIIAIIAIQSTF